VPKNGFPALTQLGGRNSSIYQSTKLVAGAKNKIKMVISSQFTSLSCFQGRRNISNSTTGFL
jgi:hypothetical protein